MRRRDSLPHSPDAERAILAAVLLENAIWPQAAALSAGVRKLDYLIAQGKIPAVKIGKRTLIARAALERFARNPETANGAERQ